MSSKEYWNLELRRVVEEMLAEGLRCIIEARKTCVTCDHFNNKAETCNKAGDVRPPAQVIAYGCPMYDPGIPF